jgi:hypothetical protein
MGIQRGVAMGLLLRCVCVCDGDTAFWCLDGWMGAFSWCVGVCGRGAWTDVALAKAGRQMHALVCVCGCRCRALSLTMIWMVLLRTAWRCLRLGIALRVRTTSEAATDPS